VHPDRHPSEAKDSSVSCSPGLHQGLENLNLWEQGVNHGLQLSSIRQIHNSIMARKLGPDGGLEGQAEL